MEGPERAQMLWNRIEANWRPLRTLARRKWSRLTADHLDQIAGKRERLLGWLQAQYGISKVEAELELQEWEVLVRIWERQQTE
jgi:uncharacterized protein YjbJ (UPF0337 family)